MKAIYVITLSISITILTILILSFSLSYYHKTFARICYNYIGTTNPPFSTDILLLSNWVLTTTIPVSGDGEGGCAGTGKLCTICFDDSQFSGTSQQRLSQASQVLSAFGFSNLTSDPQTITISNKTITVYQHE